MSRRLLFLLSPTLLAALPAADVTRTLDGFAIAAWTAPSWSPVKPNLARSEDALRLEVPFAGTGFQWCGLNPATPLGIPGKTHRLTLQCKGDEHYPIQVTFTDGWGRGKVGNADLKWEFTPTGEWQEVSFEVPAGWQQPLSIAQVTTHNYGSPNTAATSIVLLKKLVATTDTEGADPLTGRPPGWTPPPDKPQFTPPAAPMIVSRVSGASPHNVFAGMAPAFDVTLGSWRADAGEAVLKWQATDAAGVRLAGAEEKVSVADATVKRLTPPAPRFGIYHLELTMQIGTGAPVTTRADYASIPEPLKLTPEEHAASPYGLDVHGGRDIAAETFALAGIRWYRDYAFNWEWTQRSKGADNSFTGWPNHRTIADAYLSRGLGLLPILCDSIAKPAKGAPASSAPLPDRAWKAHLGSLLAAFPTIRHWELDNEYDLHFAAAEDQDGWKHYRQTHKIFAETVKALGGGELVAVENGRAGTFPDLVEQAVKGGDFNDIGVVNCHYYCGADAPERTIANRNTSFAGGFGDRRPPTLFADLLRDTVAAATSDGRKRETWLTEFGWDDLAGPRVPTAVKTAYLPRGFITALGAGVDKAFWFFDYSDAPEKAANFFSGCGLINHRGEPEPAFAAYAALTQILPAPQWVGPIQRGDTVEGAVLRSRGQVVAVLWSPDAVARPFPVQAKELRDLYANVLPAGAVTLGMAPVYAVGLPTDSPLLREAAIDVASHRVVAAAAGDPVTVRVAASVTGYAQHPWTVTAALPKGWTSSATSQPLAVPQAQATSAEFTITVPADAPLGEQVLRFSASDGTGEPVVRVVRVLVTAPLVFESPLITDKGLRLRVLNLSRKPHGGTITFAVPKDWSAPATTTTMADIAPNELRTIEVPMGWKPLSGSASASATLHVTGYPERSQPIMAPERILPKARKVTIDGDLADWPAETFIPDSAIGLTGDHRGARIAAAWQPEGLAIAVQASDAGRLTGAPKNFWEGDALEVFIATDGERAKRSWRGNDLQFWLVPLVNEGRAYLGRWGHGDGLPPTTYDVPGMTSKVVKKGDGYVLEALIPTSLLPGWAPKPGARVGVNLNLSLRGVAGERNLFWPNSKAEGPQWQPGMWGGWILGE